MRSPPVISALLHVLSLFSGACGLGYQMTWTRMFGLGLGHEVPAVLAVLAALFAGTALGAWALDRRVSESARPGRWYVSFEGFMGFWAMLSAGFIPKLNELASGWIGLEPSPARRWAVAFGLDLVALLPATVALGATLPALDRFASRCAGEARRVGTLYAANTLGAVLGTLAAAHALVPALGFRRTILAFAVLNGWCAGLALLVGRTAMRRADARPGADAGSIVGGRGSGRGGMGTPRGPCSLLSPATSTPPGWRRRVGWTLFFTGLLGVGYEVVGIRGLNQVLENTVYSYAAALSVFLMGTALGAALEPSLARSTRLDRRLPFLLSGLALTSLLGVWALEWAPATLAAARLVLGSGPLRSAAVELAVAGTVFGLPTMFMGAIFSALGQAIRSGRGGVGWALALNTLGAALAPGWFGVVGLPVLGLKWAGLGLVAGYWVLWAVWVRAERGADRAGWGLGWAAAGSMWTLWTPAVLWVVLASALPARLASRPMQAAERLRSYRMGISDAVAVFETGDGQRVLRVNNRFTMGGTATANAERRHSHIPLLLHPEPRRALFLGVGTGISFGAMRAHPGLVADGVELVPEVVGLLGEFEPENARADWGNGLRVTVADARRYVQATPRQYDVVVADLFHPGRDDAGTLYTLEHFRAVRARLALGGLFCQWLPLYQLDGVTLRMVVRAFLEVYPETRAFLLRPNLDTPVVGLVGSLVPTRYRPGVLADRLA